MDALRRASPVDVELTRRPPWGALIQCNPIHNAMKKQTTPPAMGTTFAKGVTASTVIDAVKARKDADRASFDAQWEEARQLGHVHRFAEANKKATGRTITDHLAPIAQATGVSPKSLRNRAAEGRRLIDAKGLTKARRDKLRKQLEDEGQKVSVRNVIALHTGGKTEKKTSAKEEQKEGPKAGEVRTPAAVVVDGDTATANLSDDPKTASLQWVALGMDAAKTTNVEWAEWLKMAGLQAIPAKVKA